MNNTYTFESLTTTDIQFSDTEFGRISSIVIPRIQRPYAQGRLGVTETKIRIQFVKAIFEHLITKKVMDLHFVYGAVKKSDKKIWQLELLDGQQRFTTLYLLHWYLLNRERNIIGEDRQKSIVNALSSFVYETRSTSMEFCRSVINFKFEFGENSLFPSEVIKKARWYYNRFDYDSTIMGMLVMLDAIHKKYNEVKQGGLVNQLNCLQFNLLPLFNYDMSEDLYTKMNARGLSLTPFDNFKADFTGAMKSCGKLDTKVMTNGGHVIPYWEYIGIKLDTEWIDIFWALDKNDYHVAYLLFFSRFFAYRYLVDSGVPANTMQDRQLPINTFFTKSEDKNNRNDYLGFDSYSKVLKNHPDYFKQIEKIFDILRDESNMQAVHTSLKPVWESGTPGNFFIDSKSSFSQSLLVVFGAICDFILENDTFNVDKFQHWMRLVWNVVENTNIDSLIAATGPLRNLHNLISQIDINDFYRSVSQATPSRGESWPRAFEEEIEKARRIADDVNWLEAFKEAEKHPYLRGTVWFFYDKTLCIDEFKHIFVFIKDMFDKNGITDQYKEKHLLIRAIVSHLKQWNKKGLENRYITERAETQKRLKLLLLDNDDIRKMFVDSLKKSKTVDDVKKYLIDTINKNSYPSYKGLNEWSLQVAIAHNALCKDVKLYNWMATQSSPVCVSNFKGHIAVAIPRVWYDRFLIDSERDDIAIVQMSNLFMQYKGNDHSKWQNYLTYGRFKGENLILHKTIKNGYSFRVSFQKEHIVRVYVKCGSAQDCTQLSMKLQGILNNHIENKQLYLDVNNAGNHISTFKYYLQGEYFANLSKQIYDIYQKVVKVL